MLRHGGHGRRGQSFADAYTESKFDANSYAVDAYSHADTGWVLLQFHDNGRMRCA